MISSELIDFLCTGSDTQLDETLKPSLQLLKDREDYLDDLPRIY